MAISAFFVLNLKGEVLISRLFRPDLKSVPSLLLSPPPRPPLGFVATSVPATPGTCATARRLSRAS